MKLLANEHRLLILCHIAQEGPQSAEALSASIGSSRSTIVAHLSALQRQGLIDINEHADQNLFELNKALDEELINAIVRSTCTGGEE